MPLWGCWGAEALSPPPVPAHSCCSGLWNALLGCALLCCCGSVAVAVTLGTVPEALPWKASIKYFVSVLSLVCLQTSDCRRAAVMLASAAPPEHTGTFLIPKCTREILISVIPHKPQHFVVFFQNGLIKSSYFCCFLLSSIFFLYFKISKKGT